MLSSMLLLSVPMLSYFSHLPQILSVPFTSSALFLSRSIFNPNASLLVRTHFFSASLCPSICFSFSPVFRVSRLSQSTFPLPPGVTALETEATRSPSCSRAQAEQREMELMSCGHTAVVKAVLIQFARAQALFVAETRKRFNTQGG